MKIEHPWLALLIVFGIAALINWYGMDGAVKLVFLIVASFGIYRIATARRY